MPAPYAVQVIPGDWQRRVDELWASFDEQDECCGFGGLFSLKNAEISASMMERKLTAIEASGADRIVSCDLGCLLHLEGGARRRRASIRVQHIAELLDEAAT